MHFIDTHCHLNLIQSLNSNCNIKDILHSARICDVKKILTVATSIQDYEKSLHNFKNTSNVLYSCGIHPLYKNIQDKNNIHQLSKILSKNNNIIAIGETGLDFYHSYNNESIQKKIFEQQIRLGIKYKKPIIIHTRNSILETIKILSSQEFKSCSGIIHSFTGDIESARKFLNLGFYISFSGIVTFKNAKNVQESAKFVPIDRLLIETDAPYLTPEPHRGKFNQPHYLIYIAKHIANLRNISIDHLKKKMKENFYSLFQNVY
ncbi:TatD family hydrolase [Buchnera aphidicola]|uniref:TatD family hydrolase n=1 Tax=Buchnera aphidicola TaxID=9 RepID=UPI0034644CE6